MLEKPRLADEAIRECLHRHYGLSVSQLEFMPLGYDAYAGVYRVTADDQDYFLKIKWGSFYEASVQLPRFLKDHGLTQVAAPFPTKNGREWVQIEEFILILYPFIEGTNGMESVWTDDQWIELGSALRTLHQMTLAPELVSQIRRETFASTAKWGVIGESIRAALHQDDLDPAARDLAQFWQNRHEKIDTIMQRAEALGRQLQGQSLDVVLCHADIHVGNVLLRTDGRVFIVDWDQPLFAPKERDFVFLVNSTVGGFTTGPRESDLLFQGYGASDLNPLAMAYYRYDWLVQDIVEFGDQVLQEGSASSKADATRIFKGLVDSADLAKLDDWLG